MMGGMMRWALMSASGGPPPTVESILGAALLAGWDFDSGNTLNGANVASTTGKYGTSAALAQGTATLQPELLVSWRNGHNAVRAYDAADVLDATLGAALNQPCTIYVVGEWAASLNNGYIVASSNGNNLAREFGGDPGMHAGSNVGTGTDSTRPAAYVGRWVFNGASSAVRVKFHGAGTNQATGLNPGTGNGTTTFHVGGCPVFGSVGCRHSIACVLVCDGVISGSQDTAIDSFLLDWAGVTP